MLFAGEDGRLAAANADKVRQAEPPRSSRIGLSDCLACHTLSICASDPLDKVTIHFSLRVVENRVKVILRLQVPWRIGSFALDVVQPPEPTLQVVVALIHQLNVQLAFIANHVELRQQSSASQSLHVLHSGSHELFEVECGRVVEVVAEDRLVGILTSSRRMLKPSTEEVAPCHWLITNAMLLIYLFDFLRDDVICGLHVDLFTQPWHHH